ncbi:MAG: DUF6438 domain-containing protein [Crocinitomicaceae bacterium]|nr:DUF6438 domain-containing protein [Crocinitomicaceae bacterium]
MWKIRNIILFISVSYCLTALYSCASTKPITTEEWSIDLHKGGCLDVCRAYTISVSQDGTYLYNGTFNVKHLGKKTGKIQSDELEELKRLINLVDWPLKDTTYGNQAEDSADKKLIYTSQNGKKIIQYYRTEPQEIRILELFMDKIIDRDDF